MDRSPPHAVPRRSLSSQGSRPPRVPRITRPPAPAPAPARGAQVPVPPSDLPLALPAPPSGPRELPSSLAALRASAEGSGMAAAWRSFADAAAQAGFHDEAARAYRAEAAVYRRLGDRDGALVEEAKALEHETTLEFYLYRRAGEADAGRLDTGQRLEPALGCYLGAFVDRDDSLRSLPMENQRHGDVADFAKAVGRRHASYFMYRRYGERYPAQWAAYLKQHGAIPHLALEPTDLAQVRDDEYLRQFVEDVRRTDWPVFIRFAGEMNGAWTPYHGDPAAYRKAFRTVYRAFRRAPKAALIWCPNTVPQGDIAAYYPGDDATDWVGVNFYSVLFEDDDPDRPADRKNPADMLDYVYRTWGARKPVAIGEWAASHRSAREDRDRPDFAADKIAQLYASLPTKYPRVKLVSWYDCNNLVKAVPGRQLNNYLVTSPPAVREAYRQATASPWYLGPPKASRAPVVAVRCSEGEPASAGDVVDVQVRTFTDRPSVYLRVDGQVRAARRGPAGHRVALAGLEPGSHTVEVLVYEGARFVSRATRSLTVR